MTQILNTRNCKGNISGLGKNLDIYIHANTVKNKNKDFNNIKTIYIHYNSILYFIKNIFPKIKQPVNIFIGGSDHTFPNQIDLSFPSNDKNIIKMFKNLPNNKLVNKLFVENLDEQLPKTVCIPLGIVIRNSNQLLNFNFYKQFEIISNNKPLKVTNIFRIRNSDQYNERKKVYNLYINEWKHFNAEINHKKYKYTTNHEDFLKVISMYPFILCVHGNGFDPNPKLFEAILVGTIPIIKKNPIITDIYKELDLPVVIIDEWNKDTITESKLKGWYKKYYSYFENKAKREKVLNTLSLRYWTNFISNDFPEYILYTYDNNVIDYIYTNKVNFITTVTRAKLYNRLIFKKKNFNNKIKLDYYLNQYINDTDIKSSILNGFIYHKKQLDNILGYESTIYSKNKILYLKTKDNNLYDLKQFIKNNIYSKSVTEYLNELEVVSCSEYPNTDLVIILFIGNFNIGENILKKLKEFNKNKLFYLTVIISTGVNLKIINIIKENFSNYYITTCKEYGNDIIPSVMLFNKIKNNSFNYILKLHTKSDSKYLSDNMNYLTENYLDAVTKLSDNICHSHPEYIVDINTDDFNKKFSKDIALKDFTFIKGSCFLTKKEQFNFILEFIINYNNYMTFFNNNMYDDNTVICEYSPPHFLERLFGFKKI